jgi:4'-phosphopantetheinyl transferase EntD
LADLNVLEGVWRELLPACVKISAGPPLPGRFPLSPNECNSLGIVSDERRREFELGRMYARQALSMIGVSGIELPREPDGAPIWPEGVIGSITHARSGLDGHFAAAVGRKQDLRAIGIDVEYDNFLQPQVWPQILTQCELSAVLDLPVVARAPEVVSRWCIKEATAKAIGRPFSPSDVELDRICPKTEHSTKWSFRALNSLDLRGNWQACSMHCHGLILAAVVAQ